MIFSNEQTQDESRDDPDLPSPQPFLKWAGGKTQLLARLHPLVPRGTRYFEPFLGGGALFFSCQPARAVLTDVNAKLINAWLTVRDDPEGLIGLLAEYRAHHGESFYYEVRARYNSGDLPALERAAAFIYLNKTGFNGLYRENGQGYHNVPFGRYRNPSVFDAGVLRAASRALREVEIRCQDFEQVLATAIEGDFVYFDPPYHPLSGTARFTAYTRNAFGEAQQELLADVFRALDARGCRVLLSNSDTPYIRALYKDYRIDRVRATRAISCVGSGRGGVSEVLVRNYVMRGRRATRRS